MKDWEGGGRNGMSGERRCWVEGQTRSFLFSVTPAASLLVLRGRQKSEALQHFEAGVGQEYKR